MDNKNLRKLNAMSSKNAEKLWNAEKNSAEVDITTPKVHG